MTVYAFTPAWGSAQAGTLAAAGNIALIVNPDNHTIRVKNTGTTNTLTFRTYNSRVSTLVASALDYEVSPGSIATVGYAQDHDRITIYSLNGTSYNIMTGDHGV